MAHRPWGMGLGSGTPESGRRTTVLKWGIQRDYSNPIPVIGTVKVRFQPFRPSNVDTLPEISSLEALLVATI